MSYRRNVFSHAKCVRRRHEDRWLGCGRDQYSVSLGTRKALGVLCIDDGDAQAAHDRPVGSKAVRPMQKADLTILLQKISQIYFRELKHCEEIVNVHFHPATAHNLYYVKYAIRCPSIAPVEVYVSKLTPL
jgi:hypothetical protein